VAEKGGRKWGPRGQGGRWQGPGSSLPRQLVGRWNRQFCPGKTPRAVSAAESEPGWESWAWKTASDPGDGGGRGERSGRGRVAAAHPRPGLGTRWPRGTSRLRSVSAPCSHSLPVRGGLVEGPGPSFEKRPLPVDLPQAQGPLLCVWSKTSLLLEVRLQGGVCLRRPAASDPVSAEAVLRDGEDCPWDLPFRLKCLPPGRGRVSRSDTRSRRGWGEREAGPVA